MESTVNLGWKFIVRPIGEYFMLPIINFIYKYIGNFGIAIILFSVLIKILLYPLSIGQLQSAVKMQLLQPEATKIREKYKDSMQEQQKAMMALYSEYGVNPMGGCLPMVLQMPILYALWAVLSAAIDLRQADFVFWIHDLSIPDVILHLPFKLPLLGIDQFSGLALLMGATLFIQQKMTITDPNQKMMVYLMPFMFTFMFSSFPAGLNLYYFMFNLLGILQQLYITKVSSKNLTLADLKKMPKKESWLQKKMAEAQEIAASQGRTVPGMPKQQTTTDKSKVKKANYKNKN
jgi:YidC/Oxa1 family membrane protein insertase